MFLKFLNERLFDMSELKSLIDAVESSKFITEKKSKQLVEKIGVLTSKNKAMELKRNLCVEGRLKSENEQVYHVLNVLNDAINQGKKVFRHKRRGCSEVNGVTIPM